MTEAELIQGCIANDRKAQEQLYRQHFAAMMSMSMRYTSDRDLAAEIVNSGMLRVFQKIQLYEAKGSLEGWIRRIVFHAVSDHFKKEKKYVQFMVFEEKEAVQMPEAVSNVYYEDLIKLVHRLPSMTQKVFTLYAIEGFSHLEIGAALNISDGTSKWHVSNARQKLKNWMQDEEKEISKIMKY
jgi:RNA polymerase sigma-70 factor (ECF subfamily)